MPTQTTKKFEGFSQEERDAMKARAKELANEAKAGKNRAVGEKAVQEAIAGMTEPDKSIATKLHAIVSMNFPELMPRTWYGFPAYAKDDKILCFLQYAGKFKSRYATLGFNDTAKLDDGSMWPTAFGLKEIDASTEARIIELLQRAI